MVTKLIKLLLCIPPIFCVIWVWLYVFGLVEPVSLTQAITGGFLTIITLIPTLEHGISDEKR